jgi:polyisoprenoid-binding protein YceI
MTPSSPIRTSLASVLAFSLTATAAVFAQDAARAPFAVATARVSLSGTSNIHDYTASSNAVRVTTLKIASGLGSDLWSAVVKPGALQAFEIAIPGSSLHSTKDGLDKNMHKALKVKEHADIVFRLARLEPKAGAGAVRAIGVLRIAGVEKEVGFDLATQIRNGGLVVTGSVDLLMTDFGIAAPKAMMGMLRTDPKVTVSFEVVLSTSLT